MSLNESSKIISNDNSLNDNSPSNNDNNLSSNSSEINSPSDSLNLNNIRISDAGIYSLCGLTSILFHQLYSEESNR